MSDFVGRVLAVVGVAVLVFVGALNASAAPEPVSEPSLKIFFEWSNTDDKLETPAPWLFDLGVELTSSDGQDFGGQCRRSVKEFGGPSLVTVLLECFDIPNGSFDVGLVGIPDGVRKEDGKPCASVQVPPAVRRTFDCVFFLFSPGIAGEYPPASMPTDDNPSMTTTIARPASPATLPSSVATPAEGLPVTGRASVRLLVVGLLSTCAGLLFAGFARRRSGVGL